jgi:hypothetical protein
LASILRTDVNDPDSTPPRWEQAVGAFETLGAVVACAVIATAPAWLAVLAASFGVPALPVFVAAALVVVVVPAAVRVPGQPQLDAYRRWGTHVGRVLRAPLSWAASRRTARSVRALGASSPSSSTAAPALSPHRSE